jgi:UDP-N-acetyl-D-mannosaminuronate dehydrogenase
MNDNMTTHGSRSVRVIGQGHVGLPLDVRAAERGCAVDDLPGFVLDCCGVPGSPASGRR